MDNRTVDSSMVAMWGSAADAQNGAAADLFITAMPTGAKRYPLPMIKPRAGRTQTTPLWEAALKELALALGLDPERLDAVPMSFAQFRSSYSSVPLESLQHMWCSLVARWQRANTALYWHVRASLQLDGPSLLADQRRLLAWCGPGRASGRSLVGWVRRLASLASEAAQVGLLIKMQSATLAPGSHVGRLEAFARDLYELWLQLAQSDPASPRSYWQRLLVSLPVKPEGSALVMLRVWLAGALEHELGQHFSLNVDDGIDDLIRRAALLGVPPAPAGGGGSDQSLHLLGADGRFRQHKYGPDTNDCNECDNWACFSNKKGGKKDCICDSKSTFDINKLPAGPKRHAAAAREYSAANPGKSLKGVKFSRKPDSSKPKNMMLLDRVPEGLELNEFEDWPHECVGSCHGDGVSLTMLTADELQADSDSELAEENRGAEPTLAVLTQPTL